MSDVSVHDAIFTTRAMRRLKPDPVPVADLEYVVEAEVSKNWRPSVLCHLPVVNVEEPSEP